MGTQWSDKLRQAAQAILPPGRRLESPVHFITLKQLTKGSGFGRIVQCVPGQITIIQDAESRRAESFRDAILGKSQTSSMSVRIGGEELRRSEMYVVGANDFVWEAKTAFDALRNAGAPEREISHLLDEAGLSERAIVSPTNFTPAELKKLSILHSLFAKARLLIYDRPFSNLDEESIQSLARMMLASAVRNQRVALVLGEMIIPECWDGNEAICLASPERLKMREDLGPISTDENQRLVELVRNLSGNGHGVTSVTIGRAAVPSNAPTDIVTRPQMIFDATRVKNQTVIRSEVISNPNVPPELRQKPPAPPTDEQKVDSRARTTARLHRSPSGRLTRVTWRKRLLRFRPTTGVRAVLCDLLFLSGPAVRKGGGETDESATVGLNPVYRNITSFLLMLLFMLVLFGTVAVTIRWSLR